MWGAAMNASRMHRLNSLPLFLVLASAPGWFCYHTAGADQRVRHHAMCKLFDGKMVRLRATIVSG
jgi:hypothetical protein